MYEAVLLLLIIGIGLKSFNEARKSGTWSWMLFLLTLSLIGLIVLLLPYEMRLLLKVFPHIFPDYGKGLLVLIFVGIIMVNVAVVTVIVNTLWKRRRSNG